MPYYNPVHPHCGPANPVSPDVQDNEVDEACRKHDLSYSEKWFNPYITWTKSDRELMYELSDKNDLLSNTLYKPFFYGKRTLAYFGMIPSEADTLPSNDVRRRRIAAPEIVQSNAFDNNAAFKNAALRKSMAYGRGGKRGYRSAFGRRRFRRKRAKSGLSRYIRRVVKSSGLDPGHNTHTHRFALTESVSAQPNQYGLGFCSIFSKTGLQTALGDLLWINTIDGTGQPNGSSLANPGYVNVSSADIHVKPTLIGWDYKLKIRNNSSLPAHLTVYKFVYKRSTTDSPTTLTSDGITKKYGAALYPAIQVTESEQLIDCLYLSKPMKLFFMPGDQTTIKIGKSRANITCDIQSINEDPGAYLQGWTRGFLYKLNGVIAHDSAAPTNIGYAGAQLDFICEGRSTWRTNLCGSEVQTSDLNNSTTTIVGANVAVYMDTDPTEEKLDV